MQAASRLGGLHLVRRLKVFRRDEDEPERRPQEQEGRLQGTRLLPERPTGSRYGDAGGVKKGDEVGRHAGRRGGGEWERGGEAGDRYEGGDEEAVAGVQRVGEERGHVS